MGNFAQILEFDLSDETVNHLNSLLDQYVNHPSLYAKNQTHTKIGKQTINLIRLINEPSIDEISKCIKEYISNYYGDALYFWQFFIDYMHFISYDVGGHQLAHTHHGYEDHSFLIYLNNSNAITKFYYNNTVKKIKSKKGKIVIFDASLYHEASKCNNVRKIAVGAIKFSHKVWIDRRIIK